MARYTCICIFLIFSQTFIFSQQNLQFKKLNQWGAETKDFDKNDYSFDVPSLLIVTGTATNLADKHFYNIKKTYTPNFNYSYDDYIQYLPAAVMLGLKLGGVKGRSTWSEMLVADAFGMAMTAGAVQGIKYTMGKQRPDASRHNSFPSGHTATAFMSATMLHKEYGHYSPWISIGAYTCATLTGLTRQMNNRHWMSDVIAGAGLGILSVELGYLFSDAIFSEKYERPKFFSPPNTKYDAPSFLALNLGLKTHLDNYKLVDHKQLNIYRGGSVVLEGAYYFNTYWGVGAKLDASSYSYKIDKATETSPFGILTTSIGVYNSIPIAFCFRIESKALAGYGILEYTEDTYKKIGLENNFNISIGTSFCYWSKRNLSLKIYGDYIMIPHFYKTQTGHEISTGLSISCMF